MEEKINNLTTIELIELYKKTKDFIDTLESMKIEEEESDE